MVVEGSDNRRLAIECDGARYHGPERYFDDLSRQRVLERAGWTFWRCWGSNFYRDTERVLADLFETLEEMGIEPIGNSSEELTGHVEYREVYGMTMDTAEEERAEQESAEDVESGTGEEAESESVKAEGPKEMHIPDGIIGQAKKKVIIRRRSDINGLQQTLGLTGENPLFDFIPHVSAPASKAASEPVAKSRICVCVNDTVSYCFVGANNEVKTVQIVTGPNQPSMGIINVNAPLAKALIETEVGDEVEVHLPTGARLVRILEIEKA